jgi:competence protein ComEC
VLLQQGVRFVAFLIAASLAAGLALGDATGLPTWIWISLGAGAALGACLAARRRPVVVILVPAWFCAGASLAVPPQRAPPPPTLLSRNRDAVPFEGWVVEPPARAYGRTHVVVDLVRVRVAGAWSPISARARVTLDGLAYDLATGDFVLGRARFLPPRVLVNPGGPDVARTLRYAGISLTAYARDPGSLVRRSDLPGGGVWPALDRQRAALASRIGAGSVGEGALVAAFFLGDRGRLERADREAFARAGLSHTLAVSGQHLAVIAFLLYRLLAWVLARWEYLAVRVVARRPAAALALVAATLYTLFVGAPHSAVRALAMAALYLGGVVLGRASRRADALWLGAAAIVVASPGALFDAGFQLSVLAVVGLLWVTPAVRRVLVRPVAFPTLEPPSRARRLWSPVAGLLAATAGAAAVTSPLVAYHFHLFTPLGLVAGLVVVPILELWILPVSLAAAILSPLGDALWALAEVGAAGVRLAIEGVRALDAAALTTAPPSAFELVLLTAMALLLPRVARRQARWILAALAAALGISLVAGALSRHLGNELRITFLSVGHGDAAVVQMPGNRAVLIDGGGAITGEFDVGRQVVAPALRALGVSRLDAIVLSHPHPDHAGGLAHVLESFEVGELWDSGRPFGRGAQGLERVLRERPVPRRIFRAGAPPVRFGDVEIDVLHPLLPTDEPEPYYGELGENDNSLTLVVRYGRFRALFPGDLEAEGEEVLLESRRLEPVAVLKSPHHGSRTSSTSGFLSAVRPRAVVFSVGENSAFGFPHSEVVARLEALGARSFRTDLDGAVTVETDGKTLEIRGLRSGKVLRTRLP